MQVRRQRYFKVELAVGALRHYLSGENAGYAYRTLMVEWVVESRCPRYQIPHPIQSSG